MVLLGSKYWGAELSPTKPGTAGQKMELVSNLMCRLWALLCCQKIDLGRLTQVVSNNDPVTPEISAAYKREMNLLRAATTKVQRMFEAKGETRVAIANKHTGAQPQPTRQYRSIFAHTHTHRLTLPPIRTHFAKHSPLLRHICAISRRTGEMQGKAHFKAPRTHPYMHPDPKAEQRINPLPKLKNQESREFGSKGGLFPRTMSLGMSRRQVRQCFGTSPHRHSPENADRNNTKFAAGELSTVAFEVHHSGVEPVPTMFWKGRSNFGSNDGSKASTGKEADASDAGHASGTTSLKSWRFRKMPSCAKCENRLPGGARWFNDFVSTRRQQ